VAGERRGGMKKKPIPIRVTPETIQAIGVRNGREGKVAPSRGSNQGGRDKGTRS